MKLSTYLADHSLSVADFAGKIGVTPEAVRRYALNKRVPRRQVMERIILATGGQVRVEDFFPDLRHVLEAS